MAIELLSYTLAFVSITLVAFLRMNAWGASYTYLSVGLHLLAQTVLFGAMLWLSSLFGPVDAGTISSTALFLILEAIYRLIRRFRS